MTALALSADACSTRHAYLYGLVAAGSPRVSRVIEILADEVRRTMTLIGISSIAELKTKGTDVIRDISNAAVELGHVEPNTGAGNDDGVPCRPTIRTSRRYTFRPV